MQLKNLKSINRIARRFDEGIDDYKEELALLQCGPACPLCIISKICIYKLALAAL